MVTRRQIRFALAVFFAMPVPALPCVAMAQPAKGWEFGEYRQFTTSPEAEAPGVATRALEPALRLSRVAVQRPQVAPGESVKLIAEYQVSAPDATISVKETRVIRFEGQQVADRKSVV